MPSASVTYLGVQWCGACQDTSSKEEGKFLQPRKSLVGLFGFGMQSTHSGSWLWPMTSCQFLHPLATG